MRKFGLLAALTLGCMLMFSAVAMAATSGPLTTDPESQSSKNNGTGVNTSTNTTPNGDPWSGQSYRMTQEGLNSTSGNGGTSYDSPTTGIMKADGYIKYDSPGNQKVHSSYSKTSDACASCHTIHTSVNQGALLQWEDPQTACWACHDGTVTSTYDVVTGTHNDKDGSAAIQVNSAGLFGLGTGTAAEAGLSNHGMSPKEPAFVTTAAAPGGAQVAPGKDAKGNDILDKNGNWNTEFTCVACHDPHGTLGNARILNPNVNGYADAARAEMAKVDAKGETLTTNDNITYKAKAGYWMGGHGFDPVVTINDAAPTATQTYTVDNFNGQVVFDTALNATDKVKVLYSPGLIVNMDVKGKLTSKETVKYEDGINKFCGACHTDYNNEGKTKGTNGVGGAYKEMLGEYSKAYRHSVGFTRTAAPGDANFTDANSLNALYPGLKFDTSNPKKPGTIAPTVDCLTCHYAHGASDQFITDSLKSLGQLDEFAVGGVDANGNPLNAYGDKAIQTYDPSRTSALKRLPNMGVCQACHDKTGIAPEGIKLVTSTAAGKAKQDALFTGNDITLTSTYDAKGLKTFVSLKDASGNAVNFDVVFAEFNLSTRVGYGEFSSKYNMATNNSSFQYGPVNGFNLDAGVDQITRVDGKVKADAPIKKYVISTEIKDPNGKVLTTSTYSFEVAQ